jgi:hypothetical protein
VGRTLPVSAPDFAGAGVFTHQRTRLCRPRPSLSASACSSWRSGHGRSHSRGSGVHRLRGPKQPRPGRHMV